MKKLFFLISLLTSLPLYAFTCTEFLEKKIINIHSCRYGGFHKVDCPKIFNQYESFKSLMKATWPLKLNSVLTQNSSHIPQSYEVSYAQIKDIQDLRGKEIKNYFKTYHKQIRNSVLGNVEYNVFRGLSSEHKYGKSFFPDFFRYIDKNYQDYFMRYVRILNREIPWDELEKIEKGLSLGEVLISLEDLNQNKCSFLMERYGLKITWQDVARETIDNFFKNLLSQKKTTSP